MSLDAKKEKDSIYLMGGRSEAGHHGQDYLSYLLPVRFLKEMERFSKRNSIVSAISDRGRIEEYCCRRCLKAHAIKTARDMHLDRSTIVSIQKAFPGAVGHNGYYMNQDHLVNIEAN